MARRFGVEIESFGMTRPEVAQLLCANGIPCVDVGYSHRVLTTWKVVVDASIREGRSNQMGFELVSPPMSGPEGLAEVARVVELVNAAGCDVDKTCGIHVHVEANDLTAREIANVFNRYRKHEEEIDRAMPASRRGSSNRFCKSIRTLPELAVHATAQQTAQQVTDRYYKVNLTSYVKYGTIEFRQHSGSLNAAKITTWIRFVMQFVEASRLTNAEVAVDLCGRLRGKTRTIVELLQSDQMTVDMLASRIDSSVITTRSLIRSLRLRGIQVRNAGHKYSITRAVATTPVETSLWSGVESSIRTYYTRRVAVLAAA